MTTNDRLAAVMLAILLAMTIVVAVFAANDPNAFRKSETHPQFASMQVGGPAAERDEDYWWVGWLIGSLMFAFTGGMVMFGIRQTGDNTGLRLISATIILMLLLVFTYGSFAYRDFGRIEQPLVKSIAPWATKVLLFGVWIVPSLFSFLYVLGFDRWFMMSPPNSPRDS